MADDPKASKPSTIPVVALARGYFGGQVRERGDKFEIASDTDLGGWMEPTVPDDIKRLASTMAKKPRPAPPIGKNVKATPAIKLR